MNSSNSAIPNDWAESMLECSKQMRLLHSALNAEDIAEAETAAKKARANLDQLLNWCSRYGR